MKGIFIFIVCALTAINGQAFARTSSGNNPISVKDFGAKGDGVTDDTGPIQNAINSVPAGSTASLVFPTGKYLFQSLDFGNRILYIDGEGSTLVCSGSAPVAITIENTTKIRSLNLDRGQSNSKVAFHISGIRSLFQDIQVSGTFATVFDCYGLKESHFSYIRSDNDTKSYTGNIFSFNYCVNNSVTDCMIGFCENGFFFTCLTDPKNNNKSEGILISNCIVVFANKAARIDCGTQITLIGDVLDFCKDYGVFQTNGQSLVVQGCWVAARGANGFIGIGCTKNLAGGAIIGNTIHAGNAPVSGNALSLTGQNIAVSGNYIDGLNGGLVTDPSSKVSGNTYAGNSEVPVQGGEGASTGTADNVRSFLAGQVKMTPACQIYNLTGSSNVSVTLPSIAECFKGGQGAGSTKTFLVKIAGNADIAVKVEPSGNDQGVVIDGQSNYNYSGKYQSRTFYTDGTNWFVK